MVWSWLVNWDWFIYWGWVIDWFVNWGWLMYWSWVIYWLMNRGWMIDRCWLMNWSWSSISLIRYIGNITSIVISSVFDVLTSAIRKQYRIMSVYVASIGIFGGFKVGTSI